MDNMKHLYRVYDGKNSLSTYTRTPKQAYYEFVDKFDPKPNTVVTVEGSRMIDKVNFTVW